LSDSDTHRRPSWDRVRWVSRTALNPSHEIRIFRFFVPGTFVPGFFFLSFLLDFRSPTEGMAERREAVSFILSRA